MPAATRALVIVLVALAGLLTGFLAYRARHQASVSVDSATPSPMAGTSSGADEPAVGGPPPPEAAAPIPQQVPDLTLPDLSGSKHSLHEYLGTPLIINFWATWCAPCRREMPLLQQLRHDYAPLGLQVVGIALDFRTAVADYVHKSPVDYPLLIGEDQGLAAAQSFGMQEVLPFSVFADARGQILALKVGELHRDEADYILVILHALAGGRVNLEDARADISKHLKELAIAHAKAGSEGP
ncbi:MAG TPA: TlpA disulfide reductase family protein [Steroidobacteraceae bacterium]|jgi:thiol-disulfide isomerase/thioredoxin